MTVAAFRAELVEVINGVEGLSCSEFLKDGVNPPDVLVDYELGPAVSFAHGAYQYTFHAGIVYGRHDPTSAQLEADRHKDPQDTTGLFRVLCDRAWTSADYVLPTGATGLQQVTISGTDYLLVDFTLEVVL